MSVQYQAVSWNPAKRSYDMVIAAGAILYLGAFIGLTAWLNPTVTIETLVIRGSGTLALLLMHVVLAIGPVCRLEPKLLPLLYNRRHLGVTMFCVALVHGVFSLIQFHALRDVSPLVNLLVSNTRFDSVAQFPFQILGFAALVILFLMAATSHDFWLSTLGAPAWKRLHMMVYVAYALLIAHVALGALQSKTSPILAAVLGVGLVGIVTLHLIAGPREREFDDETPARADRFVEACDISSIPENCAKSFASRASA